MSTLPTTAKPAQPAKPAKSAKPPEPEESETAAEPDAEPAKPAQGGRRKLLLLAIPAGLAAVGAGLWFGGVLRPLLGLAKLRAPAGDSHADSAPESAQAGPPASIELPEIVTNLNVGPRRNSYIKLHARLELARPENDAALKAAMPRLLDLFQTYLREMRPEELRGSEGTYRLREELIARANIALASLRVTDVLFTEMLIQ
jgi:flagellar FliL protein